MQSVSEPVIVYFSVSSLSAGFGFSIFLLLLMHLDLWCQFEGTEFDADDCSKHLFL